MMTIILLSIEESKVGHSQAAKAESRERIIAEAAQQIRRDGLESVSVGSLMKSVGLTHGGFYGHFDSRSALLAEALQRALSDGEARAKANSGGGTRPLTAIARSYLSRSHRDARESGCAIAALASDVGRADEAAREVMEARVNAFIDTVAATMGGDDERAMLAVSAMVGALALARVITNRERSDTLLRAVRDHLAGMEQAAAKACA